MKRVLLVSLHFHPLPVVASERSMAIARELSKLGWSVDVLTHNWQQKEGEWDPGLITERRTEDKEGMRIFRIGASNAWRKSEAANLPSLLANIRTLWWWLLGWVDARAVSMDSHFAMDAWMKQHLPSSNYDLLLGVFSPHTHARLLRKWGRKCGIPVHLDFRDLWDNMVLSESYRPKGSQKIRVPLVLHYWKKWLRTPISLSTVSEPLAIYLREFSGKPCLAFATGYHSANFPDTPVSKESFIVLHAGTLYNHQRLDIVTEGLTLFLASVQDLRVSVEFSGAGRLGVFPLPGAYLSNPLEYLHERLSDPRVSMGPRVELAKVRKRMREASVLLMPTFPGSKGIYSGKLFDYLGAGRAILACPNDGDVISETIAKSGCGTVCNTSEALAEALKLRYAMWKQDPMSNSVESSPGREWYSQQSQVKMLSEFLTNQLRVHPKKK